MYQGHLCNLIAIDLLELFHITEPSQVQIDCVESAVRLVLQSAYKYTKEKVN